MTQQLNCSSACWVIPAEGGNPCFPHCQTDSYHWDTGEAPHLQYFVLFEFSLSFYFHWWGKDLQYCFGAEEPDSLVTVHLSILFRFFLIDFIRHLSTVPCPYSRCLLNISVRHIHQCLLVNLKVPKYPNFWPFSFGTYHLDFCDWVSVSEVNSFLSVLKFRLQGISYAGCLSLSDWLTKDDHR